MLLAEPVKGAKGTTSFQLIKVMFVTTEPSTAPALVCEQRVKAVAICNIPNVRLPEEFRVRLTPNSGYSSCPRCASVAKKGGAATPQLSELQ